jgi:subfamily B ATP-binding cassette protein MsbA
LETLNKLVKLTRAYWPPVVAALVCGLLASAVMGGIAWLVKPALDIVFLEKKYQYMKFLPFGVIILFTVKGFLHFGQQYLMKSAGMSLIRDTQNRLHDHILVMPVKYFDSESSGVLMSRVMNDVSLINGVFSEVLRAFVIEFPKVMVLLGIAFYRKWDITLTSLALVPLLGFSAKKLGKKVKQKSLEAQKIKSLLTERLSESITGIRIIKVFNRENFRAKKFIEENRSVLRANMKAVKYVEINKLAIDFMTGIAIAFVLFYGGGQVVSGKITPGDFASILTAIYFIFTPVKLLGESYTTLQTIKAAFERIDHVFDTECEEVGTLQADAFNKELTFENVTFVYPAGERPAINEVNLTVKKGEVLALVGPSGAGKTTLANLIPRFYNPTSGVIRLDGRDIRDIHVHSLRKLIGIVSQDVLLFNDTVRANIAFGREDADEESIRRAAEMAYATEFIDALPQGYDTLLGERGMNLSGGQRQRIAIARAIIKNPPILILDEATSSLDSVSEALVQKALDSLMQHRTTIVIAHRLSTIVNADTIAVVEDGKIAAMGSHSQLITSNDTYMRLYNTFALSMNT